jgi:5-dehydro-2-deoxygluconokinase
MTSLARLSGGRFLLLGRAGMDFYADPPGTRADHASRFVAHLGGSSANVAVALARLGLKASLLTVVSDDAVGRFCLRELQHYGVDTKHVHVVGGEARTSLAVAESRLDDYQVVIYRNGAADFHLAPEHVAGVDFAAVDALAITGTALAAEPSRSATFEALARARASGAVTILDVDYRPYSWPSREVAATTCAQAARQCDIVVGNEEEFDLIAGASGRGFDEAQALAARGAALVVHKRGAQGCVALRGGESVVVPPFSVRALKPVGAGDAFLGGMLAALAEQRPLPECIRRGAAAAALVVARVGCAPAMPTREELDAFLADPSSIAGSHAAA